MSTAGLRPLGRILRARDVGLYQDAAEALALARAEAAQLRADAEGAIAMERDVVLASARAEADAAVTRALTDVAIAAQQTLAAMPLELAGAIADGVARVVGGLDLAEAVARTASRALAELVERHGVVVRVAPLSLGTVQARLKGWSGSLRVVVETRAGFVRAGLQEQLDTLAAALRDAAGGA